MLCYKHDYMLIFLSISYGSNPLVIPGEITSGWVMFEALDGNFK